MSRNKNKGRRAGAFLIGALLGLIIGAVAVGALFYVLQEKSGIDWREYVEGTLIPQAIAVVASIGTACLFLKPTVDKIAAVVAAVVEKFKSVTEDVSATVTQSARSEEEIYENRLEIAGMKSLVEGLGKNVGEALTALDSAAEAGKDIRRMLSAIEESVSCNKELRDSVGDILTLARQNKEIAQLAFGSMDELVKKGSARRIMTIASGEEEKGLEENENKATEA